MAKRVSVDRWLFGGTLLLVLLGLVMVFSASAVIAKDRFGSPYTFVLRQIGWSFAGVLAMVVLMRVDYRKHKHPAVVFTLLGVTTVLLVAVLFLDRSHNTHRWIRFGVLFVAGMELKYLGYGVLASLPALYYLLFDVGFRRQRMLAFVNPWADPQGAGFHMIQSLIAVGTGGITGIGLMEGKQKLFYLPE